MTSFFDHYTVDRLLGEGSFGIVWLCKHKPDGREVAIKQVDIDSEIEFVDTEEGFLPMEIHLLKKCSHIDGVVKIYDYLVMSKKYYIVMEAVCEDLFSTVSVIGHMLERTCKVIFKRILKTVIDCHHAGVFHGDLKLENIAHYGDVTKLIDFGGGSIYQMGYLDTFKGTVPYCPPEWIQHKLHDAEGTTVWTLGILLFEMCQGEIPYETNQEIVDRHLVFKKTISPELQGFIKCCLRDLYERPSLRDLKTHIWLEDDV